jgi:ankyrin repeat protein
MAESPDARKVLILLEAGAEVNMETKEGQSPLSLALDKLPWHYYSREGPKVIAAFTKAGARPKTLFEAASVGSPEDLEKFLVSGVDLNAVDSRGLTPLERAAHHNQDPKVIEALLKAGARLDSKDPGDWTALEFAAAFNPSIAVFDALWNARAKTDDDRGQLRKMLELAVKRNPSLELIKRLAPDGTDFRSRTADGNTLLTLAIWRDDPDVLPLVDFLIAAGSDVNAGDIFGFTPVVLAAAVKVDSDVLAALIRAGADVCRKYRDGETALLLAANSDDSNPEIIKMLLNAEGGLQLLDGVAGSELSDAKKESIYEIAAEIFLKKSPAAGNVSLGALAAFATDADLRADERLQAKIAYLDGFKAVTGQEPPKELLKHLLAAQAAQADRSLVAAVNAKKGPNGVYEAYKSDSPAWRQFCAKAIRAGWFSEEEIALADLVQRVGIATDSPLPFEQGGGIERAILALRLKLSPVPKDRKSLQEFCLYQTVLVNSLWIMGCYSPEHINTLINDRLVRQASQAAFSKVIQAQ